MNIMMAQYDRVRIAVYRERPLEPAPGYDHCVVPHKIQEVQLTPGEYEGRLVMRYYDREIDTLYIEQ